jgi:hypothetical protein
MLEKVSQRSGAVVLRNCTLELYQGRHMRLAVTKWGKLSVYPDNVASTPPPPSKMNIDRNFSLIDLSVVASEMVDTKPASDSRFNVRQSRGGDNDPGGSGSGASKSQSSKGGLTTPKHQQTQSSKRSSKSGERRQSRGKTTQGGPMTVHFGGIKPDSRQTTQTGQVMYQAIPGFSSYEQTPRVYTRIASRRFGTTSFTSAAVRATTPSASTDVWPRTPSTRPSSSAGSSADDDSINR